MNPYLSFNSGFGSVNIVCFNNKTNRNKLKTIGKEYATIDKSELERLTNTGNLYYGHNICNSIKLVTYGTTRLIPKCLTNGQAELDSMYEEHLITKLSGI